MGYIVESEYLEPVEENNQTAAKIVTLRKMQVKDKSALYFLYNAGNESGFEKFANVASSKEA